LKIVICVYLCFSLLGLTAISQNYNTIQYDSLCSKKVTAILSTFTDLTFSKNLSFVSCGLGGAIRFDDKIFIGLYGLGLISEIKGKELNNNISTQNYNLNFSHGGIWLGYLTTNLADFSFSASLKAGYGAAFLYNPNTAIDFNNGRDDFFIILPSINSEVFITEWLKLNIGFGASFIKGFSSTYINEIGKKLNYYKHSSFEGANLSFALFFGSFCKNKKSTLFY